MTTDELIDKVEEELKVKQEDNKDVKIETPLDKVNRALEEVKKVTEENKATLQKMGEMQSEMKLSGTALAGKTTKPPTQEEIDQAEAKAIVDEFV